MLELSKLQVEKILKSVCDGLNPSKVTKEADYYRALYPQGVSEGAIAEYAEHYPELRPLMAEVAEKIVSLTSSRKVYSMWIDSEEQAGSLLTRSLALCDKKYCQLFADCLLSQDLEHEVNQNTYILDVLDKWKLCAETALILEARSENSGQGGHELLSELREEYGEELNVYLKSYEQDVDDNEEDEKADVDVAGNCMMQIMNKTTLELVTLSWDKGSNYMMLTHNVSKHKFFKYESAKALRSAVQELQERCGQMGCVWKLMPVLAPFTMQMAKLYRLAQEQPSDIFKLFTPKGKKTPAEKQLAKHPCISCKKIQMSRDVLDYVILICDTQGQRILKLPVYDESQFLWHYQTDDALRQGLEKLKGEYLVERYELVLEEELDYPFQHVLEQTEQAVTEMMQADDFDDDED